MFSGALSTWGSIKSSERPIYLFMFGAILMNPKALVSCFYDTSRLGPRAGGGLTHYAIFLTTLYDIIILR
jgi:hypothetical protein